MKNVWDKAKVWMSDELWIGLLAVHIKKLASLYKICFF